MILDSNNTLSDDGSASNDTTVSFPENFEKDLEEKETEPPEYVREMIEVRFGIIIKYDGAWCFVLGV